MSENNLTIYESARAIATPRGKNYVVKDPFNGNETKLVRDVDFGTIPGTTKPSLYKSGALKIANIFGMFQHYTVENAIERFDEDPFCYYRVRCDLVKVSNDGKEYIFSTGHGSANTKEKRNGRNSAYDASNSTLKIASKRALTSSVIAISGLADLFSMDLEDMEFMNKANDLIKTADPKSLITTEQGRVIYAIGASKGMNANMVKAWLKKHGINSTKEITQEQYETILETLRDYEVTENEV